MDKEIVNVLESRLVSAPVSSYGVLVPVKRTTFQGEVYTQYLHPRTSRWVPRFCETSGPHGYRVPTI